MISFILSIVALLLGFFIYSRVVEKIFGSDPNRKTPAIEMQDNVDYVPMGWGKIFLIQFLNIPVYQNRFLQYLSRYLYMQ